MGARKDVLQEVTKRCVEGLGCEFVGVVEWYHSGGGLIRVYADKPGGIAVEDCARISNQLKAVLLVEDSLRGQMSLEVSSPGLDRPLFTPEQYTRFVGQDVRVYLVTPKEGRRIYKGQLVLVTEDGIRVKEEQSEHAVSFSEIKKAHVVGKR